MEHPYIFTGAGISQAANDPTSFNTQCMKRFGEAAERLRCGYSDWPVMSSSRAVWRNALAAEALSFPPAYRQHNPPFTGFVEDDARPGGDSMPEYGVMKRFPAAAALFPMSGPRPRIGRVWAFGATRNGDLPPASLLKLEGSEDVLAVAEQQRVRLYAETGAGGGSVVTGKSWHLAAHMAMDALLEDDLEYRIRLATEWLITGKVNRAGRVMGVGVKNKPLCGLDSRRRWLVPDASAERFVREAKACGVPDALYTPVGTRGQALDAVKGCVAKRRDDEQWPVEVAAMHALVGSDTGSLFAALKQVRVKELHLWPLEESGDLDAVCGTLRKLLPRTVVHVQTRLPDCDLEKPGKAVRAHFAAHPPEGLVLFNVSGGTWLVQSAVEAQARHFGFQLVYQKAENKAFVKVWYERHAPQICRLVPRQPIFGKVRRPCPPDEPLPSVLDGAIIRCRQAKPSL
jgi:hypothetical protein